MGRKWNNIKEKKASKDANTSRIYVKFGRELYVAAKQGEPDPELNQNLKMVIERAKTYNVPKAIIDRAIEKAKGGAEENYDELRYGGLRTEWLDGALSTRLQTTLTVRLPKCVQHSGKTVETWASAASLPICSTQLPFSV